MIFKVGDIIIHKKDNEFNYFQHYGFIIERTPYSTTIRFLNSNTHQVSINAVIVNNYYILYTNSMREEL